MGPFEYSKYYIKYSAMCIFYSEDQNSDGVYT